MMTKILLICLSATSIWADFKTYQENVINIEGRAYQKIEPDMATIHVGASAINENLDTAMQQCAEAFVKMKDLFKKYNVFR